MKKPSGSLVAALVAFVAFVLILPPAVAQQQPRPAQPAQPRPAQPAEQRPPRPLPPKSTAMVVIDIAMVVRDSAAAKTMRSQAERQQTAMRAEDEKIEKDLRAAEQELVQQRTILAPEAFNQRRRDFERRVNEAQQAAQAKRRDFEETMAGAQRRIEAAMTEIVLEIAKDNDYKIVIPRAVIVASHDQVDITDEVIQRLNKKVPTVSIAAPPARR
jgi:Skp family chaperone for outer membrane proteins